MPEYEIRKWKVVAVKKRKSVKIPSRSIHSSVLISFAVFRASNRVFHPFHSGLYSKCRLHVHSQNCIQREIEKRIRCISSDRRPRRRPRFFARDKVKERASFARENNFFFFVSLSLLSRSPERIQRLVVQRKRVYTRWVYVYTKKNL